MPTVNIEVTDEQKNKIEGLKERYGYSQKKILSVMIEYVFDEEERLDGFGFFLASQNEVSFGDESEEIPDDEDLLAGLGDVDTSDLPEGADEMYANFIQESNESMSLEDLDEEIDNL